MAEIEKKGLELDASLDGSGLRVGIVHTRWNEKVVNALVSGAEEQLVRHSAPPAPCPFAARRCCGAAAAPLRAAAPLLAATPLLAAAPLLVPC